MDHGMVEYAYSHLFEMSLAQSVKLVILSVLGPTPPFLLPAAPTLPLTVLIWYVVILGNLKGVSGVTAQMFSS